MTSSVLLLSCCRPVSIKRRVERKVFQPQLKLVTKWRHFVTSLRKLVYGQRPADENCDAPLLLSYDILHTHDDSPFGVSNGNMCCTEDSGGCGDFPRLGGDEGNVKEGTPPTLDYKHRATTSLGVKKGSQCAGEVICKEDDELLMDVCGDGDEWSSEVNLIDVSNNNNLVDLHDQNLVNDTMSARFTYTDCTLNKSNNSSDDVTNNNIRSSSKTDDVDTRFQCDVSSELEAQLDELQMENDHGEDQAFSMDEFTQALITEGLVQFRPSQGERPVLSVALGFHNNELIDWTDGREAYSTAAKPSVTGTTHQRNRRQRKSNLSRPRSTVYGINGGCPSSRGDYQFPPWQHMQDGADMPDMPHPFWQNVRMHFAAHAQGRFAVRVNDVPTTGPPHLRPTATQARRHRRRTLFRHHPYVM